MTLQAQPLRRIFARFFPKKYVMASSPKERTDLKALTIEEKKEYALRSLAQGELALLQGNLTALSLFETASELDPENPQIWYRQGLAFFEYGSEEGKEKALLLASKHFKYTTQLAPHFFDAWVAWGNTLLQLGRFHSEHHFHLEAKEKYQKALSMIEGQPNDVLAELYWDYGIAWSEIAKQSGEALDVRFALEAFQISLQMQKSPSAEFYNDCGKAYLEMGLLINDSRLFYQAVQCLQKATEAAPQYFDGWISLAESYSQLYVNTMDERFVPKASDAFQNAVRLSPDDAEVWLSWAQILAESGRLNQNPKTLRQSIEKCARAAAIDPEEPLITAQWIESLAYLGVATHRLDLLIEAEQKAIKTTDAYPDDPDIWHAHGVCLMGFGRYYEDPDYYEMAVDKLQFALSLDRTTAEHWHTLGVAHKLYADLTCHTDLLERANRFFARAMDLKPSCPAIIFDTACSLLQFSEQVSDLSSLEKALMHFETLLQHHKEVILQHPQWLFEYASALEWLAHFSNEEVYFHRAIDLYSQVLLIDPDYIDIHERLAHCYMEIGHHTGNPELYRKAIAFYRLALREDEENESALLDWGVALIHIAQQALDAESAEQLYWEAEQKLSQAGQLGHPSAYYHLACLYSLLRRFDEALHFIHKALAARALPPIEEMLDDEWLDNLRETESFAQFVNALESKLQAREQ